MITGKNIFMNKVYCKIALDLIDGLIGFFGKLKEFVGEFTIEQQTVYDKAVITISFYTNKVKLSEGEDRQVLLEAKSKEDGDWEFTRIIK